MARAVIDDVLVNFVGDGEGVPLQTEFANKFEFLESEDLARRIIGSIHDDGLGVRAEGARELFAVKFPVRRMQAHKARAGAGKDGIGTVVFVERLEDHNLVTGINEGHQR